MEKVFLVHNENGSVIKACSTLKLAEEWANNFSYSMENGRANSITELEIDGETWGIHHVIVDREYIEEYVKENE